MGVQLVSSYRLQAGGVSHLLRCHDAVDAFYSLHQESILEAAKDCYDPQDHQFITDRVKHNLVNISDESGDSWMRATRGVFPGDTGAT
eukprot:999651-Pyramimonas_sp.AAC.1